MFATEHAMSIKFEKFIKTNFGNAYLKEKQGLFGIPDFVCYSKQENDIAIVSFELKLKNWKQAAQQAFRYQSFSNITYVVIASESANSARLNIDLFKKYNIGLATFDINNDFKIMFKPQSSIPYSENLNQKLIASVRLSRKKAKNIMSLAS